MDENYLGEDDLTINTSSRIPVCLCLDVSGSMSSCIEELTNGVNQFYEAIRSSSTAKDSCEISIVTFASEVKVVEDFSTVESKETQKFKAYGGTNMTEGVEKSLELLKARKKMYKENGVDYFQPWLVIMSDGGPNFPNLLEPVQVKIRDMESKKKISTFAIGIGDEVNMDVMDAFSGKKKAMKLKGYNFKDFFEWLGKSVSIVSESQVGEKITLDTSDMDMWAEL